MSYNRIAVYGHRGWASSVIVSSLAASGAPTKVLHRPGSDTSSLPPHVTRIEVDIEDQTALITALQDVDIVITLCGQQGVPSQHAFVRAIPHTSVKLFVPSDLAFRSDEQGLRVPVNKAKDEVEKAARLAGIPTTIVLIGSFVGPALAFPLVGIDYSGNRIVYTGDSAQQQLNLCTRRYVGAAYASIFSRTPPSQLEGRAIGLSELRPTGSDIALALQQRHGVAPQVFTQSLEKVNDEIERRLAAGVPLALSSYVRKLWGSGQHVAMVGEDTWEVQGYPKATLQELMVQGKMELYRDAPQSVLEELGTMFH